MQISTLKGIPSTAFIRPGSPPLSFSLWTVLIVLLTVVALADASNINRRLHLRSRQRSQTALVDRSSSSRVLAVALTPDEPQAQLQSPLQSQEQSPSPNQNQTPESEQQDSSQQQQSSDSNQSADSGSASSDESTSATLQLPAPNAEPTDPFQKLLMGRDMELVQQRQQQRQLQQQRRGAGVGVGVGGRKKKQQRLAWSASAQLLRESSEMANEVNDLSVPSLENSDSALDPLPDQRAPEMLMPLLGKFYDPKVMSVSRPYLSVVQPEGEIELRDEVTAGVDGSLPMSDQPATERNALSNQSPDASVASGSTTANANSALSATGSDPQAVSWQRLWEEPFMWLSDSRGRGPWRLGPRLIPRVERLLQRYTSCPLMHNWTDLGPRYFPRWFRQSRCLERPTCSVPAGMGCQPAARERKTLLWYFCAKPAIPGSPQPPCRWIKRNLKVITECKCACPTGAGATNRPPSHAS